MRILLLVGVLLLALHPGTAAVAGPAGRTQPNIVIVLLDDVQYAAAERLLERQPGLNALFLERGIRFTEYYGNDPLCCPGRANLLTGLYSHHHGVIRNDARLLDPSMTLATQLDGVGYWTAYAGKYLNGVNDLEDHLPAGWDRAMIHGGGYYPSVWYRNGNAVSKSGYSTDVAADYAVRFLDQAPAGSPMLLLYAPFATHRNATGSGSRRWQPLVPPRHQMDPRCEAIGRSRGPAYNEPDMSDKPAYMQARATVEFAAGWPLRKMCESLLSVDEGVAAIVTHLKAAGRFDDTLFVLTADNGMGWGDHRWPVKEVPYATRLPLYLRWPARFGDDPDVRDGLVSNIDVAPTLCALAGCVMGPYAGGHSGPDGLDARPTIKRDTEVRSALLEEHHSSHYGVPPWYAVRTHEWHYVEYATGERELYDLGADPAELENVAGSPDTAEIQEELSDLLEDLAR